MCAMVSNDEPGRSSTHAKRLQRHGCRRDQAWISSQSKVVVGRKVDDVTPIEVNARTLRTINTSKLAQAMSRLKLIELEPSFFIERHKRTI
jgi:hypothetical protein